MSESLTVSSPATPSDALPTAVGGGLPAALTSFVGREREVAALRRLLCREATRLVVLTGPGGVGKTRLALRVAAEAAPRFADGIVFVPLAAIRSPLLLAPTIAEALSLADDERPVNARLVERLRPCRLLLVLDNMEQIAAGAPLLATLLEACPGLTLLATSRVRLRVSGAHDVPVAPLPAPPPAAAADAVAAAAFASVRLFVDRARAATPTFALTDGNARDVAAVCCHLEGIPLAIELAAARTVILSPAALLARLSRRMRVLDDGPLDQPERLRSMRDAIAWSYDLLDEGARRQFRRLSPFVGGFPLEAADWVAGVPQPATLDLLGALLDASLVRRVDDVAGEPRFAMLETIHEFGQEALADAGEEQAARDGHAAWCVGFAERAEPGLRGPEQDAWVRRIDAELPNVRAAHAWLAERGDAVSSLQLAGGLGWYWSSADHFREARDLFASVVAMPGGEADPAALANALTSAGDIANWMDDQDGATDSYEQALALRRARGDDVAAILLVRCLGNVAIDRADLDRAEALLTESLGLADAAGAAWEAAAAANLLGVVACARGDFATALARHAEAAAGWERLGDHGHVTTARSSLAWAALAADDLAVAVRSFRSVLDRSRAAPDELNVLSALTGAAMIAARRGDARRAAWLFAAAAAERERLGIDPRRPWIRESCDRVVAAARGSLGEAGFAAATAQGRSRPPSDALAEAATVLADDEGGRGSAAVLADPYGLSQREREVLRVLARGASDKEIAAALFIERSTASKHVAAVLAKLGVTSRAAAAAIAARAGQV